MRFFPRHWDDPRADELYVWDCATVFVEADEAGRILPLLERYEHGPSLRDDAEHPADRHGAPPARPIRFDEWLPYQLQQPAFDGGWAKAAGAR